MNPYVLFGLWLVACAALIAVLAVSERLRTMRLERDLARAEVRALSKALADPTGVNDWSTS